MEEFIFVQLIGVLILSGIIFIVAGFVLSKFPPKEINYLYGYRTKRSMENQEIWDFAQRKSSLEMMKMGFLMIVLSFLPFLITLTPTQNVLVGLVLLCLSCVVLFLRVENAIKKNLRS